MEGEALIGLGILLVIAGMVLLLVGVAVAALRGGGEAEVGGVVVIGPVPIIFGSSGRAAVAAAVLGAIIMILAVVLYVLAARGAPG